MSTNQYDTLPGEMPPKPGMSTGLKVLLILCAVFGGLIVLCCGGVAVLGPMLASRVESMLKDMESTLKESMSNDPETVAAVADRIAHIDVPEGLAPTTSFDMKVPFTDQRFMVWVVYADQQSDSTLMLFSMGDAFGSQDQAQMRQSIDQSLQQQNMQQEEIAAEQSYTKEREIAGQPATFTIQKGMGEKSQTKRIQVSGAFQGKSGPVMLIMNAEAEKFSEEQIVAMLDSIE